jgi:Protein-tyrosine phosphatase
LVSSSFQINAIDCHAWKDHKQPENSKSVAQGLMELAHLQRIRAAEGYPNLGFHCSAGFNRSPAAAVAFLQMQWLTELKDKAVNPAALMAYVRAHRLHAFECKFKDRNDFEFTWLEGDGPEKPLTMMTTVYKLTRELMDLVKSRY